MRAHAEGRAGAKGGARAKGSRTAMLLCLRADELASGEVPGHEADVLRGADEVGEDALWCLLAGEARLDRPGPIVDHDGGDVEILLDGCCWGGGEEEGETG